MGHGDINEGVRQTKETYRTYGDKGRRGAVRGTSGTGHRSPGAGPPRTGHRVQGRTGVGRESTSKEVMDVVAAKI